MGEASTLRARLGSGAPLLLDGATGTELERRGVDCALPLWSARALIDAPDTVRAVHADYAGSGAECLTANTFRTHPRSLEIAGIGDRAAELTRLAVELAREGARHTRGERPAWVLGSVSPLEDCYRPERVPDDATLAREHALHAENLAAAGADAALVESMNCAREAVAATRAALDAGLAALVSFICWDGARLLSGEGLLDAVESVLPCRPEAVLVNCLPPSNAGACLAVLEALELPFGVYANLGAPTPGGRTESCTPREFASHASRWLAAGATLVGGCCGTTPEYIRAIADRDLV